jgi:hypothetical protein
MWRKRNILHNFFPFTWRLLLSVLKAWAKLLLGNATCGGERVRRKAASNAREGTGSEGNRRLPDDGSSNSGTTSTPSGACRLILRWRASPEASAAGGKRGFTRVGQPGRGGWIVRRRKASAVRRSGRQQGGSGRVRSARSEGAVARPGRLRTGWQTRAGYSVFLGSGVVAARLHLPPLQGLASAVSRRAQAVAKDARTVADRGPKAS